MSTNLLTVLHEMLGAMDKLRTDPREPPVPAVDRALAALDMDQYCDAHECASYLREALAYIEEGLSTALDVAVALDELDEGSPA